MFNALNRFISRLDADSSTHNSAYGASGFQVLRNKNADLAIEPWFDFIVGINGRMIEDSDPALFAQEVHNCAGATVTLGLWSAKGQRTRTLHIQVPSSDPNLGLTLQHTPLSSVSTIWHILDVPPNSPADIAGLLPYSDYIIGTPEGALHGEAGLGELVEDHIGRPLRLYVYNNEYDVTREVTIHPSRDWGGEGALGCVLGFGALHRLPAPLSGPVASPGETLFSTDQDGEPARFSNEEVHISGDHVPANVESDNFFVPARAIGTSDQAPQQTHNMGDFLVPAQMTGPPPQIAGSPGTKRDKKHGKAHGGKGDKMMDDYFMEEEQKSRELDGAPIAKNTPPPPPPKAGGPPKSEAPKPSKEEKADDDGVD